MNIIKFWAKTSKDIDRENAFHPLICHLTDVAVVTKKIWEKVLPKAAKDKINKSFGITSAGNLVAFIAGLHDLGKCSPPFTLRGLHENKQTKQLLQLYKGTDFEMPSVTPAKEVPHGYVTAIELPEILGRFGIEKKVAEQIGVLVGGHHGVFPNADWRKKGRKAIPQNLGNENWTNARVELAEKLAGLLGVEPVEQSATAKLDNAAIMILAGLVSVADWIGSDTQFFKCEIEDFEKSLELNLTDYYAKAEKQAEQALEQLGWLGWAETDESKEFLELFPKLKKHGLRQLQKEAVEIAGEFTKPGIVVIESPTGEGKTEAAMFLADTWNANLQQTGIYFALPTQATSNQMFTRVVEFLEDRFKNGKVQAQLLHSKAAFSEDADKLKKRFREELEKKLDYGHQATEAELRTLKSGDNREILDIFDENCGDCIPSVVAAEWFTARKRGLLAPFGVGTVDQALMAVLQTKHVFVRLFGLAHKTIIIDEVHAYDAYMSTLLERLLEWLAALGSPVILLSATLPIERRNKLIQAYQKGLGVKTSKIQTADYPRISYSIGSEIKVKHIVTSEKSRTLFVEKVDENFIEKLKAKLEKEGGCVAIICNTVQRSQDIFDELSKIDLFKGEADDGSPKLDLLHSRFRFTDRDRIEKRVRLRFGKEGEKIKVAENGEEIEKEVKRPDFAVLVSTQIIEQSLDIDFDLMISDLAPVDLLLQRAGRLHRHDRERKAEFKTPTLWLIEPKIKDDGLPNFENSFVYDEHILLRTWLELNKKEYEKIEIPKEVEKLIEAVYEPDKKYEGQNKAIEKFWEKSLAKYEKDKGKEEKEAENRWIAMPNAPLELYRLLGGKDEQLEEDSLAFHKQFKALTRLNANSLTLVCLHRKNGGVFLDSNYEGQIDYQNVILHKNLNEKEKKIVNENIKKLLGSSLSVIRNDLILAILESEKTKIPSNWEKSPLLKSCRVLRLDENSSVEIQNEDGEYFIHLHPQVGLKVRYFKN